MLSHLRAASGADKTPVDIDDEQIIGEAVNVDDRLMVEKVGSAIDAKITHTVGAHVAEGHRSYRLHK
jgi:hypothetical protein